MSMFFLRLFSAILSLSLMSYYLETTPKSAYAASENLVWKPYLQQLTSTSVIIVWTTQTGANPPVVRYSTDTSYDSVAWGSSRPLIELNTQWHRVQLTGLEPNTTYYYKIYTDGEELLANEVLSFRTAPYTGSVTPFSFLAFGDYGKGTNSQKRLRDQMLYDSFNFIFTTGDNAYSDGTYIDFDERLFSIYADILSRVAIFPTLGNHDVSTDGGAPYLDLFDLPDNAWRAEDLERYYSFDYGSVHFVALDSNYPLDADDEAANDDMFDWLRADLDATTQPWKIVALHYPAYSTGSNGADPRVQSKLVPIFEEYGVNLVLTGHEHNYQRSKPLLSGKVTPEEAGGIVYIVSGGGHQANEKCGKAKWLAFRYCSKPSGIYARITVDASNLAIEAIDEDGMVADEVTIPTASFVIMPVEEASISGPETGIADTKHTFTVTSDPFTTTLPITYVWQATGYPPVTSTGGLSDSVTFKWSDAGPQFVTVTVTNAGGTVTDTHAVTIMPSLIPKEAVTATVETEPVEGSGDAADDPAIWIHPTDPALSTIIGTDKKGGLEVYDLAGNKLQVIPTATGNVDLRYNFPLGGEKVDLVAAYSKTVNGLVAFKVNPATRLLEDVLAGPVEVAGGGTALYHSPVSDKYYYFSNTGGTLTQYELFDNGSGKVDAALVRTVDFGSPTTEGVVADDVLAQVYVSEETKAIWKLSAEPDGGSAKTLVDKPLSDGGNFQTDAEGLAIYYKSDGTGYLIASSQGNNSYTVYTREANNQYLGTFEIVEDIIDGVTHTDGLEVTNFPLGATFPDGVFVVQDGTNKDGGATKRQNFKLVPWGHIADKLGLDTDPSWNPRDEGSTPPAPPPYTNKTYLLPYIFN